MSRERHLYRAMIAVSGGLLLAGCAPHPQSTLSPQSDYASNIQNLFMFTVWVSLVVFAVVVSALLYAAVRFRGKTGDPRPRLLPGNRALEIAWTAAPALILTAIAVPTVGLIFQSGGPAPATALQVTAIGHQWWFEFQYPDQKIVTADEMHIPVGQPVNIALKSADVIHSLWVPELAGKRDMIPNHTNYLWFTPEQTGTYPGQCAEFCGIQHANMRFSVVVETPADFAAWVQTQQRTVALPATAAQQAGATVFQQVTCAGCHTIAGTAASGTIGPNLTHFGSRQTIAAGVLPNTPTDLEHWLQDPDGVKPGNLMGKTVAAGMLSQEQVRDLTAYLESLQ